MDCPFFIDCRLVLASGGDPRDPACASDSRSRRALAGGTAFGEHFGEKISPLPPLPPSLQFEVIDTGVEISSRWAYEQVDAANCAKNTEKTRALIEAIRAGNAEGILKNIHNDFEEVIFKAHPQLLEQAHPELLQKKIALASRGVALLAGSGGALILIHRTAGAP